MISEALLLERIDALTSAVQLLAASMGQRLTRAQLAERMGVHRNTISNLIKDPRFPAPCSQGKWLLSEIIEWEKWRS